MRRALKFLTGFLAMLIAGIVLSHLLTLVDRQSLGISAAAFDDNSCTAAELPVYDANVRERTANDYLLYSTASLNAYATGHRKEFNIQKIDTQWKKIRVNGFDNTESSMSGFHADAYFSESSDKLRVLVAFRGTNPSELSDFYANFSWYLQWLPIKNQYDDAREFFKIVRSIAVKKADDKHITYVAVGHSLGGGLAQHVTFAFPCVSAAVFNTSFVANRFRLAEPFDTNLVVHIHEDLDRLTWLKRILINDDQSKFYRHYEFNMIPKGGILDLQHSMARLGVGMARLVTACQWCKKVGNQEYCPIKETDIRAQTVYCDTYGTVGPDHLCQSRRIEASNDCWK